MSIVNNLKKHIEENKDKLRCGFCSNQLIHSTKANVYDFPDIESSTDNKDVYGILCDDCQKQNRTPNNIVLLLGDKNNPINKVYYIPLTDTILLQKRNIDVASIPLGDIPPSKNNNKSKQKQNNNNPNARTEEELKQIEKDILDLEEQNDDGE